MEKGRRGYLLLLLLLAHGGYSDGLRRQTRQLPRIPFLDNLLARFQGRPSPPPPRVRPPLFESGFTPLSSPGGPSIADSVDLTFQSLEPPRRPVGPAPRPQSRPPQIDAVGLDSFGRPPATLPLQSVPFPPPSAPNPPPSGPFRPPSAPFTPPSVPLQPPSGPFPPNSSPQSSTPSDPTRRATLREVLQEDCADFEERGYCESPHRYPTAQVHTLMARCSRIVESLYVPLPVDSNSVSSPVRGYFERANHKTWSWAQYSKTNTICASEAHTVTPSYARDASGKWVVVLQHGNMVQRVPVDRCVNLGASCLSELQAAHCEQRHTHHHLVTWDPDAPNDCPTLRVFAFPTACLCKLGGAKT
ncbi:hypothetical protein J437_LFUL012302 [Ladona fulva]|uniref:Spaetzle domain-containing protein n=1 Tax=Ladona fulva TaxID=123851 RepID=A0A8K0KBH7_LADFU|nr:hypothetical protein J437_LFUL012302 [Ladona fulva]